MIYIKSNFDEFSLQLTNLLSEVQVTPDDLKELGEQIVLDIKKGIDSGTDLRGNAFVPNTKEWIKRKKNNVVMKGKTGALYNSIKVSEATKDRVVVEAVGNGLYWQINPKYTAYKRDFFGLSQRILEWARNKWR